MRHRSARWSTGWRRWTSSLACTDSMKAMLVYTASSCGVSASGIRETAPTVPWMVSSRVRPVKTRMVSVCSSSVIFCQLGMSLETGTFSGSQKLPVRRSQTSRSFSSSRRFQLIAETRSMSFSGLRGMEIGAMGIPLHYSSWELSAGLFSNSSGAVSRSSAL